MTAQPNDFEMKMTEYCRLYIAETDGDIAGYAFCAFSPNNKHSIKLSYLATKNKYRNKGIAKALIKNCIEDTNADYCLLHSNKKLLPFYEKNRF
nr:GNAT family N-acetyltransferase [Photobacterium kishitanii]